MRWSQAELDAYRARIPSFCNDTEADDGPESELQGKIEKWCREKGYPFLSFHQSRHAKMILKKGWPDMTILLPYGRTLFLELKAKGGRFSKEQKLARLQFMALGHQFFEVRSYKRFLEVVK